MHYCDAMPKPTNIAELKTALLSIFQTNMNEWMNGMICHRSSLIKEPCDFERDFDFVLLQLADTLNTQFKSREGSQLAFITEAFCWRKSCAKFHSLLSKTYWIQDVTACSLEKQESPAITDKPARRESVPKIVPIRRAYNVVADNYWPIFMRLAAVTSEICEISRNSLKIQTYEVQGHPRSSILVPIESPYVTCY